MRLGTQESSFVFNLPADLIPNSVIGKYDVLLEKNFIQYPDILSYLNSTIKGINFGGLSIDTPMQIRIRGKEIFYKPVTNINDIFERTFNITFRAVDGDINYWLLLEIVTNTYMNTDKTHLETFSMLTLDINRDAIYQINFDKLIITDISDCSFSYNTQGVIEKTFTMTCKFNFININFLLNEEKVLTTDAAGNVSIDMKNFSGVDNNNIRNRYKYIIE